jgi:E3 ubiquitin-protein ligase RNF14
VHIEVPDYIDVSTKLSYGDGTLNYAATHDDDDLFYKFRVEHLPPILLTCLLPTSYPSHRPPFFTISTYWLDKGMISPLCRMLDMLWEEQQGMEVTYQWVQWLQSCSLSHLGFANEVVLRKSDVTCYADGEDKRACPDYASPDVIIPRMMRYNDNKHHEAFLHAIHDCMICLSECPGNSFTSVVSAVMFMVLLLEVLCCVLLNKLAIKVFLLVVLAQYGPISLTNLSYCHSTRGLVPKHSFFYTVC